MNNFPDLLRKCALVLLTIILTSLLLVSAQDKKPFKTGLVLSGGGAKGLAQVGMLQLIDSLEIQVDYIAGTSMGAIVGGLYSVGYPSDTIYKMIHEVDWDYLTSNDVPLNKIHINEKDHYGDALIALPVNKFRPGIPEFLVEGQYLSETLAKFFFPARDISDFHQLPIPFEAIAADILTGEKVVLRQGSLTTAIRASMAIPAFFSPVIIDDRLLVDGGLRRNFPVEEVREMGADFVIGGYTGFRTRKADEMKNALNSLYQSFAIDAVADAKEMMRQTDILLDLSDALKGYGTQSFGDFAKIIHEGKLQAQKLLPQLQALKKRQMDAGIVFQRRKITEKFIPIRKIETLAPSDIPMPEFERDYILAVMDTANLQRLDTFDILNKKIDELFSHRNYSKIHYSFSDYEADGKSLNILAKKATPTLKLSLHYDTYQSAGIAIRYTANDLLMNNSLFSAGADLSYNFKANVQYVSYIGRKRNTWIKLQYDYRRQKSNDMFFKMLSQVAYFTDPHLFNNYHLAEASIGFSPSISSLVEAGATYKDNYFVKDNGAFARTFSAVVDSMEARPLYHHRHFAAFAKYKFNTLNNNLFPTSGNRLQVSAFLFFHNSLKLNKPNADDKVALKFYEILNPENYNNPKNKLAPIWQFTVNEHAAISLSKRSSLQLKAFAGVNFKWVKSKNYFSSVSLDDYSFLSHKFNLGGYDNYRFDNQFAFPGYTVNEVKINNLLAVTAAFQWNAWKKLYITPKLGYATSITDLWDAKNEEDVFETIVLGIDFDYMSFMGPVKLSLSTPFWRMNSFFSLGYQF